MLSPSDMLRAVAIGNDAGWALTFHRESDRKRVIERPVLLIGRDDYDAAIEAAMPEGFGPGKYTFRIEGLTDKHYAAIRGDKPATVVRLHLYWRDANSSVRGYLANVADLEGDGPSRRALAPARVAELAITNVSRTVGVRRYECVIEARERVFTRMREQRADPALAAPNTLALIRRLTLDVGVEFEPRRGMEAAPYGFNPDGSLPSLTGGPPGVDPRVVARGTTYAHALADLGKNIEAAMPDARGRGVLLIRNGKLIVGKRPIPLDGKPHELTHANGFIDSERVATADDSAATHEPTGRKPTRDQFKLTLKGRPDIRPGDVVRFSPAVEDGPTIPKGGFGAAVASFAGPLVGDVARGPQVTLYVNSVEHKLSRASGFATALVGVRIEDGATLSDAWDEDWSTASSAPPDANGNSGGSASATITTGATMKAAADDAAARRRLPDVGEVRVVNSTSPAGGAAEPPAQTLTVWEGLAPPDGYPGGARRLPVVRTGPAPLTGVPYATPFAWGRCGLVLPRYPGTRTLLVHRNGQIDDPVDVGAVWESGRAPDSQPGDWWLILPVGVTESRRAGIPDSESPPGEHEGKASNDLIDAEGCRTIEVGELTIRVGRNELARAGTRPPAPEEADAITIEHTKEGAKITIKPDGTIAIDAAKDIELNAPNGDIRMDAVRVKVSVDGAMEVS